MKRIIHVVILALSASMSAQPASKNPIYLRVSTAADTVTLPAGAIYYTSKPAALTGCDPTAPSTTCTIKGVVYIYRTGKSMTITVSSRELVVPATTPGEPDCPDGMVPIGRSPSCRVFAGPQ